MDDQRVLEAGEQAALEAYIERAEGGGREADCLSAGAVAYSVFHPEMSADEALVAVSRLARTLERSWRSAFIRRDRDREWSG
jgi:hypothetical protein